MCISSRKKIIYVYSNIRVRQSGSSRTNKLFISKLEPQKLMEKLVLLGSTTSEVCLIGLRGSCIVKCLTTFSLFLFFSSKTVGSTRSTYMNQSVHVKIFFEKVHMHGKASFDGLGENNVASNLTTFAAFIFCNFLQSW